LSGWFRLAAVGVALSLAAGGCTTVRETSPQRTATEQLLISAAADQAAERLSLEIPRNSRVFVDATNFEGTDGKYAIATLRDRLLRIGAQMAVDRSNSDVVVEIRSGALSLDEWQTLVGIPKFDVPIPLAGSFAFPEIALFKKRVRKGVAKFAATGFRSGDGGYLASSEPQLGYSQETQWVVLLFISWTTTDVYPEKERERPLGLEVPTFTP
jgi:hypothetical protein